MYLDRVKKQLIELRLASPDELLGCTQDEVIKLEVKLGFLLPKAYQEFILLMGNGAGKFLRGSDCFFRDLPCLKTWAIALLEENNFPESLPEDAFVTFDNDRISQTRYFCVVRGRSHFPSKARYTYGRLRQRTQFSNLKI